MRHIEGSPPGCPVPGILQARTLEWAAISFSNAWKWKVKAKLLSCVWLAATSWTAAYQAPLSMGFSRQEYWTGLPLPSPNPSPTARACSNSCPWSWWGHPTVSSSVVPFSSCLQSFTASGSFPRSKFFTSGGQNIAVSASTSVLPVNILGWFPLELTGLISLQSRGYSRFYSSITVREHQFFGVQPSFWSKSHIHTWLLEKP